MASSQRGLARGGCRANIGDGGGRINAALQHRLLELEEKARLVQFKLSRLKASNERTLAQSSPPPPPPPPRHHSASMVPGVPQRPPPPVPLPPSSSLAKMHSMNALLPGPGRSASPAGYMAHDCMSGGQEAIYENLADLDLSFLEQSYLDRPRSSQSRDDDLLSSTSSLSQQTSHASHNGGVCLDQASDALKLRQAERSTILDRLSEIERGLERIEHQFHHQQPKSHPVSSSSSSLVSLTGRVPGGGGGGGGGGVTTGSSMDHLQQQQQHHHHHYQHHRRNLSSHTNHQHHHSQQQQQHHPMAPMPPPPPPNRRRKRKQQHQQQAPRVSSTSSYADECDGDEEDVVVGTNGAGLDGEDEDGDDDDESPPPPYSVQAPPSHSQPPPGYVGQPPRIASSLAHQRWGERLQQQQHHLPGGPGRQQGLWGSQERVGVLWPAASGSSAASLSSPSSQQQPSKGGSDMDCQSIVSFQSSGEVGVPVGLMSPSTSGSLAQLLTTTTAAAAVAAAATTTTASGGTSSPSPVCGSPRNEATGAGIPASTPMSTKAEMVYHLLTLLGHQEPQHMSQTLLTMSQSPHNCSTMRHSGCLALLIQLIHGDQTVSKPPNWTARGLATQALRNIVNAEQKVGNEHKGRREARVLHMLEIIRDYAEKLLRLLASSSSVGASSRDSNNDSQPGPAMATLMKLSFDEDHRHAMTGLGGLQAIAELMEVDHLAHGIIGLSSSGGAVTQSYSSTSSDGQQVCVTLRRYAGMALTNLTFGDSGNKATLCSYRGFMLALVAQLQSCSEDLRQVTASVLRNLSWRADVNSKQVLREVGSVSKLMTAAIEANRESTLKSILSALWNLSAHCSANKAEICATPGALEFLVDTLSYEAASKTLAVVENAGGILRNVSSHVAVRDDYRRVLRDRHCLEVLLGHLRSPSLTVVSNACGTLWNLSARSGEDQATLWALGAPQMLKSLVHSKHRMIAMGSSAALKNLMSARPAGMESSLEGSLGSPVSESGFTPPPPPRLQARKQKVTPESLVSQNLAETCENLDQNLHSPMSPGHPMSSWSQLDCGKPPGYHVAWRPTPSHAPPPPQQQPQQQPPQIQLQHSQTSRCFVERSDSRDSVHSIRSDSFCDRWNRHPVVETSVRNNMPQALDLSCRSRSQDPLSQYAVKDTNPLKSVNNNNSGGSIKQPQSNPANSVNNNMTEMEFAARVNEISQSLAHHQIDDCFSSPKHKTDASSPPPDCKGDGSGVYAETDLDNPELPVDYSLIYAEEDDETKFKQAKSGSPPKSAKQQYYESSFHDDAVRTYCTEGTPYSQTPYLVSNAGSLTDLTAVCEDANAGIRGAGKRGLSVSGKVEQAQQQKGNGDHANADKPKTYCVEDTPLEMSHAGSLSSITGTASDCGAPGGGVPNNGVVLREKSGLSRGSGTTRNANSVPVHQQQEQSEPTSSRSSLGVDPRRQSEHMMSETSDLGTSDSAATLTAGAEDAIDEGAVTPSLHKAGKTVTFCAKEEETPLMFSRASSLDSLSSTDQHSIRSSVVSDFSRRTSGVVSPSELPDSPGGTMPPSPNRLKPNPRAFESGGDNDATGAPRGDSGSSPAGATSSSSSTANGRREGKPRSRVSSGGKGGEKRKHENNRLSGDMGAFADETRSYAVEGTPFLQSHATSLSSLVNFDDEDEEQEGGVLQPCANQDSSKAKITPPVSKLPKTSKPVGVVEPTSKSMQKSHSPAASTTSSKSNLQSESKINCPAVAKVEPQRRTIVDATETPPEYVTVFATEDTPANISHAGSTGNLSNLSFPSEPSFTHRLKQNGANDGNAESKSPLGNQPGSDSSYKSSRCAGKKAPLSPERKKEEPKRLVACDDEDGDDDDVLLQCIQSAMPKKKAPAVAGSGGGAMSTTTAKSSSGRTSSREKSSSRRSPSKTSKNADPGESKQQQQHTRQAPPVFQIPPPPPPPNVDEVHAVKPTVNHRHNHRHEKSCNDENEAPLYENLAEIFGADAGCKTSVPHPRSRSVSALGNAGLEDDDDEDAESYLLQRCIQFGMPKSRSDLSDAKPFQRHRSEHSTRHSKKSASAERRKASDRVNGISSMMQQSTSSSQVAATASETLTHSQIIRRDARSMVTALIANRDSMVDSYASSTSTSDNLMESANPPPGLLMEDSVVVSSSMTESRLLGSPGYRPNPGFGGSSRKNVLVSVKMTGSSSGGVAVGKMACSRALEGSMSTSSAFFETAKPPFPEDMDHSMISIASITSEMAMSSAMKSSVTSENMFDLYRTAAAAMTAVYVDKAAPGTGNKSSTDDLDDSEMLADVQPPADLASSSIMGASLFKSASHESASSHDISGDKRAAAVAAEIGRCASGKKTSPKEKRQMDKERYQTYTLVVHGGNNKQDDGDIGETDSTAAARADEEEEVLRKQRKSRSGDKERYRTQTLERKQTPQRPRSSPEGSSETDTADRTPRKSESDPLETDLDADDQHQQQQRRRHHSSSSSTASKPRIVKPDENGNNSNTTTTTGEDPGASKAVRGRRRPLHAPKTGTFTRPKPSPELAALRSRIPDVSDSDSTVTSVDSSTFTRRPKSSASLESAGSSTAKPRSPLVVRETKTTKLRKQSSSPAAADLLRSSSNISVASSVSSHGSRRTPKVERKTQQPQVSVPPSKIAMLWRRADEARESQEVVAAKTTTTTASKRAPPQTATTAAAGIGKRLAGASGGAGAPPPIPAKPKIKLTQKIGRFIKGSKETKPAATPAAKEFIYRPVVKKTEEKKRGEPPEDPEEKTEEVLLQQQQK